MLQSVFLLVSYFPGKFFKNQLPGKDPAAFESDPEFSYQLGELMGEVCKFAGS